jgi:hypothetical protein
MTDRPNTLSGLVAKRNELVQYRDQLEADIRAVTVDIDHLEAGVRIFDPEHSSRQKALRSPPRGSEGSVHPVCPKGAPRGFWTAYVPRSGRHVVQGARPERQGLHPVHDAQEDRRDPQGSAPQGRCRAGGAY